MCSFLGHSLGRFRQVIVVGLQRWRQTRGQFSWGDTAGCPDSSQFRSVSVLSEEFRLSYHAASSRSSSCNFRSDDETRPSRAAVRRTTANSCICPPPRRCSSELPVANRRRCLPRRRRRCRRAVGSVVRWRRWTSAFAAFRPTRNFRADCGSTAATSTSGVRGQSVRKEQRSARHTAPRTRQANGLSAKESLR